MPSELQPRCLVMQATEALKRPQSARVFGDGSEQKVANSFSMGMVTKTVILAMGVKESWPIHSAWAWLPRWSCLLARFNGHRVATLVVAVTGCTASARLMAISTKYMAIQIFELHGKMHAAMIKLRCHCTRSH